MKYLLTLLIGLMFMAEGCRPPRCTIPTCYVRLKHRHGGETLKAAANQSNFDPENPNKSPEANLGKEYRGVPWWKKNTITNIGEGYKPGYKYDYRKPKYKKPKDKKSRNTQEETAPDTGEEQLTEEGEVQPQNEQPQEDAPAEQAEVEEAPKKKGLFGRKKEKKSKQPKEEEPVQEEQKPQEENDGF